MPLIQGGGQELGIRSGTENTPGIIGFATALDITQAMRDSERRRLQQLQQLFISQLQTAIPDVQINGSLKQRLPNNVHITIPGLDNERAVMQLDEAGILCATGSACSASKNDPSHVLAAMAIPVKAAQSTLRFTLGRSTTKDEVLHTTKHLAKLKTLGNG